MSSKVAYQPVSCTFYDELILFIQQKTAVQLTYRTPDGCKVEASTILKDIYTRNKEEFVKTSKLGEIRLDCLLLINGKPAKDFC